MTIINWDTRTHALNFNEEIKKVYENEIKKNRKKFTSWIGKISEMHYKGNLDWHISTPASRNPFVSDLYKNICITKTFIELQKRKKSFEIIVSSKSHFILLNQLKKKNSNIEIKFKKNFFNFSFFKNLFKSIIFQILLLLFVNLIVKKKKLKANSTLIDIFQIENEFHNNRYYKAVATKKFLRDKNVYFIPTFIIGKGIIKTLKTIYQLRHKKNILFKEQFLGFKDLFNSLIYYKNLNLLKKNYSKYDKIDYSEIIFEEIKNDNQVNTILISKLNYFFVKNLSIKKIKIKKIVNWFENQQIDKAWNYAFRKFYPKSLTLGYQGFTLYPQYMCTHPSISEENCKVIPEKIILVGKAYSNSRKEFFKSIKIIQGPALSFQHIFKQRRDLQKKKSKILVILTGYAQLDYILIKWCQRIAQNLLEEEVIIKPHPHLPIKNIVLDFKIDNKIHINYSPLEKNFPYAKLVISCGPTSATIESLAYGISLIVPILDINDKLIFEMIKINKNYIKYAKNEDQLIKKLKSILNKKKNLNIKKEKLNFLRNYLFNRINNNNLRLFC